MANPVWAPALWTPNPFPPFPDQPPEPEPAPPQSGITYNPWTPAVYQRADWTCSCAASAWMLNSLGDTSLGHAWNEWDVVETLRATTYELAVSPLYGLARADMADLETMYGALGYTCQRKQYLTRDDVVDVAGVYPLQINGARWYHHSGARMLGPGVLELANPAPLWRGVGQDLSPAEAALWGSWNGLWVTGRVP
jgi:hypothetical protein